MPPQKKNYTTKSNTNQLLANHNKRTMHGANMEFKINHQISAMKTYLRRLKKNYYNRNLKHQNPPKTHG
jgi:uncharacterized membrane protein